MSSIRVATAEDHIALMMSRCEWQPGDVIQPMLDGERRTMRVTRRIDEEGQLPRYYAVDKHGTMHWVWVMDDPRPGCLADAEEEE